MENISQVAQVIEVSNSPGNINSCICKENKIKFYRPKYDVSKEKLLDLFETIGFIVV